MRGVTGGGGRVPRVDTSRRRITEYGLFQVTLAPAARRGSWQLQVRGIDRDAVAARIDVEGGEPRSGRRLRIHDLEARSSGLTVFHAPELVEPGWWVLRVRINAEWARDAVSFNIVNT